MFQRNLNMDVFYPYPPEKIWNAIAKKQALATWLMDNDFEARVGHKFCFQTHSLPGLNGVIRCEVLEVNEPRLLSYLWQDSLMQYPSIVRWILTPINGGTQLQLEHRELKSAASVSKTSVHSLQSESLDKSKTITQTITAREYAKPTLRDRNTLFASPYTGYTASESIIFSSFINGGWHSKLNEKLPLILVDLTPENE